MKNLNIPSKISLPVGIILIIIGLIVREILDIDVKVDNLYGLVPIGFIILLGFVLVVIGFAGLRTSFKPTTRRTAIIILISAVIIGIVALFLFGYSIFLFLPFGLVTAIILMVVLLSAIIQIVLERKYQRKTNIKIAITILIIGSLCLIIALLVAFGVFDTDEISAIFPVGWFLIILGGSLISSQVSALTFILLGIYIFIFSAKSFKGGDASLAGAFIAIFMIVALHIILGLILGIISFVLRKESRIPKLPKNPSL